MGNLENEKYGDLNKTEIIRNLCFVPREERDIEWKNEFLDNIADASFTCPDQQTIVGPESKGRSIYTEAAF